MTAAPPARSVTSQSISPKVGPVSRVWGAVCMVESSMSAVITEMTLPDREM